MQMDLSRVKVENRVATGIFNDTSAPFCLYIWSWHSGHHVKLTHCWLAICKDRLSSVCIVPEYLHSVSSQADLSLRRAESSIAVANVAVFAVKSTDPCNKPMTTTSLQGLLLNGLILLNGLLLSGLLLSGMWHKCAFTDLKPENNNRQTRNWTRIRQSTFPMISGPIINVLFPSKLLLWWSQISTNSDS